MPPGRLEEALAHATAAIELEPDDPDILAQAYVYRAAVLVALSRFEEAIEGSAAAFELEPDDTDILALAYVNRAFALGGLGRFDEVEGDLRAAVEVLPPGHPTREIAEEALMDLEADE